MKDVEDRRIGGEEPSLLLLHRVVVSDPEVLQEVHVLGNSMPPREDLIQVALVSAIVGLDLVDVVHQKAERAVGRLDDHDAGVEERAVVPRGGNLRHPEEEIDVAEDEKVGVDEDDLVVLRELPEAELAVVPLVVGVFLGPRVSYPLDGLDLPAGSLQAAAVVAADRFVDEDHEVSGGPGHADALRCRDGPADVDVGRVENGCVSLTVSVS